MDQIILWYFISDMNGGAYVTKLQFILGDLQENEKKCKLHCAILA